MSQKELTRLHVLADNFNITISYSSLHRLLSKNNLKSPKQHRRKKFKLHPARERKPVFRKFSILTDTVYSSSIPKKNKTFPLRIGIDMFPAYSPQAKGKIERLWQTLQSRLPVIFAQNNISSLESANNFLLSYIPDFNKQFSVEPLDAFSAFVPVSDDFDLDRLLSFTFERNLSAASTVSLHGSLFKIEQHRFPAKTHVTLLLSQKHGLRALINGEFYPILRKVRRNHARFSQCPSTLSLIPLKNHPRKGGIEDITEGLNLSESFL